MKIPDDFRKLSTKELRALLKNLEEELDEIEDERKMTLGQSGVHLGAKQVERLINEFDNDKKRTEEQRSKVEAALKIKG